MYTIYNLNCILLIEDNGNVDDLQIHHPEKILYP